MFDQLALHRLMGDQLHRPARPACWRRAADHGDNALALLSVQQRFLTRATRIVDGRFQSALLVAPAHLPGGLGGDAYCGSGFHRRPPCVYLLQHQRPKHRPHRLHPATQQPLDLFPFLPRKRDLQPLTFVHASAIPLVAALQKYQP
jgi:hypothetical protein